MPLSSRKQTITDSPYIENTSTMRLLLLKDEKSALLALSVLKGHDKIAISWGLCPVQPPSASLVNCKGSLWFWFDIRSQGPLLSGATLPPFPVPSLGRTVEHECHQRMF